jgi:hypothetical protein
MRVVKNFNDVNVVVKQLQDQLSQLTTKNIDMGKRRVVNASASVDQNDYVIKSELPVIPPTAKPKTQHYSIVFNPPATAGTSIVPPFIVDPSRAGYPLSCRVAVTNEGATDFKGNFTVNGHQLLTSDIIVPAGTFGPVTSSLFNQPIPKFSSDDLILCTITDPGGTSLITMQIYVRVIQTEELLP